MKERKNTQTRTQKKECVNASRLAERSGVEYVEGRKDGHRLDVSELAAATHENKGRYRRRMRRRRRRMSEKI